MPVETDDEIAALALAKECSAPVSFCETKTHRQIDIFPDGMIFRRNSLYGPDNPFDNNAPPHPFRAWLRD
jgi:hypothetical protein